jgi:hypothetical protein
MGENSWPRFSGAWLLAPVEAVVYEALAAAARVQQQRKGPCIQGRRIKWMELRVPNEEVGGTKSVPMVVKARHGYPCVAVVEGCGSPK